MDNKTSVSDREDSELKESYSLLRIAGAKAKFGGWSVLLGDNKVTWSDQVAAIHEMPEGYSPQLKDGINFYAPEWRDRINEVFRNCTEKAISYDEVMQIITSNGNRIWVRTTGEAVRDDKGRIFKVQGSFQDINNIMQTEKELEKQNNLLTALLNLLPIGVFMVEVPSGKPIIANETAKEFLGRGILPDSSKNNLGEVYQAFYSGTEEPYSVEDMPIIRGMTGQKTHVDNMEVLRPDGSRIKLEIFGSPVKNADGIVWASLVSFIDITEKRSAEERMIKLNRDLEELNRTKDKLYSVIAHDLKTPFNSIMGFSEILAEHISDYDAEKSREFIEFIGSSARQSLTLLENLLAWSQSQSGKIKFNPQMIVLKPIMQEVVNGMELPAKIKNICIIIDHVSDIQIYADRNMLMTVVRNLISNAIKFTNSGGSVVISYMPVEDFVEIIVSDNGTGMNKESQDSLFRLDANVTTKGTANESGSGLGLILCKEFVEKHRGRIWVESEEGKGSGFHFTIPTMVIQ
jgi:signal transduction histidine kinase